MNKNNLSCIAKIIAVFKNEVVFAIALLMAISTSFIKMPKIEYINFRVIILLFNLMIVIKAFEKLKIMDKIAVNIIGKYKNLRKVSMVLIGLTFFSSMVVTNDVALLTFIPLTLVISKKSDTNFMETVIFQTLAANIGSSLTPMGNPQNLFLFTYYKINSLDFFKVMFPFTVIGFLWIIILNTRVTRKKLNFNLEKIHITDKLKLVVYSLIFVIIILSVFNVIDYRTVFFITCIIVIILDKELFVKVDYYLLATFICFFIFIGNVSNIQVLQENLKIFLSNKTYTYFSSIILSQVISNVPSAILLAGFTENWREVLLGVNIGGMGTLIGSLASVISYKLYVNEVSSNEKNRYLLKFHIYNFISLVIFGMINYVFFIVW